MRMAAPQLQTKGEAARKKKKEAQKQVEIQTITQTQTEVQVKREVKKKARKVTDVKKELDKMWRVLLLNDNIHSIDDVEDYLAQYTPVPVTEIGDIVQLAHDTGESTIIITNKKMAEKISDDLQDVGLTTCIVPDDHFDNGDEDGDGSGGAGSSSGSGSGRSSSGSSGGSGSGSK